VLCACQHAQVPLAALPTSAAVLTVPAPPQFPVAPTYPERRILLSVQFGLDEHTIRPESFATLNNLALALQNERLRGLSYEINGHTDLTGSFGHNVTLSAKRSKSVSNYLRGRGVQTPPIRAQGFGPLQLLYPADPFNAGNRRVEVIAIGP
jgi:outer membrane protein OmpA-like peptidoglycan-associated protein